VPLPAPKETGELAGAVCRGERAALAAALNLLDDRRADSRHRATALLSQLQQAQAGMRSHLIGITGPPGAGKSTVTAALIRVWRRRNQRVGVLAVDPSSPISGGALLGDRLRMQADCTDDGVFIRSLSSRGEPGGLSTEVWPMSAVMLAAFDIVLVETVGVGQGELDIATSCDTTCLVVQPGAGDSLQFLKAGILEIPHVIVVNKEDLGAIAQRTLSELATSLPGNHPDGDWQVPVLSASAATGSGVTALADALARHHDMLLVDGKLDQRRRGYRAHWMLRQLAREFGTAGVGALGGEPAVLHQLQDTTDATALYAHFRERLHGRAG